MKIIFSLLYHQWLSFWRSRSSGKNFALQIVLVFFALYIISGSIFFGIQMPKIIAEVFPNKNIINVFCGFILYYYFIDMILRFVLQELPTLSIESYLTKNISRKNLIRFLNIRSIFHFLNVLPILLFFPFSFSTIFPKYGGIATFAFDASIIFLLWFNHFIILYIKRKSIVNSWWLFLFFITIILIGFLDYKNIFSISSFSTLIFSQILLSPLLFIIPLCLSIAAFINCNHHLYKNLYIEEFTKSGKRIKTDTEYSWLNKFGEIGDLLTLEIKLIFRNKRSKNILAMSALFLFYGFIMYKKTFIIHNEFGILLFAAIFITGLFSMNYGNFLFAWQSSHFDILMTNKLPIKTYIKSKLNFLIATSSISFIIANLYGLLSWKLMVIQFAAYLFNIGVTTVITVYLATYNYKAIDIAKKAAFNYQGTGSTQWIYAFIIFLIPFAVYLPFALLINVWAGIIALAITGAVSLLLYNWWIDILTKEFLKRKYFILEGFREK